MNTALGNRAAWAQLRRTAGAWTGPRVTGVAPALTAFLAAATMARRRVPECDATLCRQVGYGLHIQAS